MPSKNAEGISKVACTSRHAPASDKSRTKHGICASLPRIIVPDLSIRLRGAFRWLAICFRLEIKRNPFLVCAAVAPHSRILGGGPDEGVHQSPLETVLRVTRLGVLYFPKCDAAKSKCVLRFGREAGCYARFAHTHYTSGVRIQRRRYCQMLRPGGQLSKFANGLRRHSDVWVYFDLHPIWQTTQSYVECGDVFGLVSHEGTPHCPAPDCRQPQTAYNHFHRGRRACQNLQFTLCRPLGTNAPRPWFF